MKNRISTAILFLLVALCTNIQAQDARLSVQGILRNADGTAVENGDYSITFRLYEASTGGTAEWEETQPDVAVKGGIYSTMLGEVNPLLATFTKKYYLGISIEGGTELIPRTELTSSPYALSLIGEDNIFPNSGNVGIGDSNPAQKLTIKKGNGRIGLDANGDYLTTIIGESNRVELKNTANKDYAFNVNNLERFRIGSAGTTIRGATAAYTRYYTGSLYAYLGYAEVGNSAFKIENTSGPIRISGTTNTLVGDVQVNNDLNVTGILTTDARTYMNDKLDIRINGRSLTSVGTDHSFLAFYPKGYAGGLGLKGKIGYLSANTNHMTISNSEAGGDLVLETSSGSVNVYDRLNVTGHIQVSGPVSYGLTNYDYLHTGGVGGTTATNTFNFAIWAAGNIRGEVIFADEAYSTSDRRIKKDYKLSNGLEDLKTLHQIEVTDYRHVDEATKGTDYKKGLIAQQVAEVFPEAVKKITDYLPSIYSFPNAISIQGNLTMFTLNEAHDLKAGDKLKMITDNGDEFFTVASISDDKSFTIETTAFSEEATSVFIFGKEVDDFHTVDYDRVYTLCVSAVQELSRQVDDLKAKNFALEKSYTDLRQTYHDSTKENNRITSDMDALLERVKTIEQVLNTTASN